MKTEVFIDSKYFKVLLAAEYFLAIKLYSSKYKHNNKYKTRKLRHARNTTNQPFAYLQLINQQHFKVTQNSLIEMRSV